MKRSPLLFLDGWTLEYSFMLCFCGEPGCPRYAWQILALSPEQVFDDFVDTYSQLLVEDGLNPVLAPQSRTLQ